MKLDNWLHEQLVERIRASAMRPFRACVALGIAACLPALFLAASINLTLSGHLIPHTPDPVDRIWALLFPVALFLWSAPIVFVIGMPTLLAAHTLRYGPVCLPPLIGLASGPLLNGLMFGNWHIGDAAVPSALGACTATLAAILYFRPLHRYRAERSMAADSAGCSAA